MKNYLVKKAKETTKRKQIKLLSLMQYNCLEVVLYKLKNNKREQLDQFVQPS